MRRECVTQYGIVLPKGVIISRNQVLDTEEKRRDFEERFEAATRDRLEQNFIARTISWHMAKFHRLD